MVNKIILNGIIAQNQWTTVTESTSAGTTELDKKIFTLEAWQQDYLTLSKQNPKPGLCLRGEENPENFPGDLKDLPIIVIQFAAFTDGRGFTIGNLLRQRFNYKGELRASGEFIRDQLFYLKRCGFNSFEFGEGENPEAAIKSLNDFSESYQIAADQDAPLFRRRHT